MTYTKTPLDLIQTAVQELPFSPLFIRRCQRKGYHCLKDILDLGSKRAIQQEELGIDRFRELVDFLAHQRLLYLFV